MIFSILEDSCKNKKYILGKNCIIWVFLDWNSKNLLSYLKSTPLNSSNYNVWWKIEILKFGIKNAWFAYFQAGMWKCYCHIGNWCPQICLVVKYGVKIKVFKFGTKNSRFGYFKTWIWNDFCNIWNQRTGICLAAKFGAKIKNLKFGTKKFDLGVFALKFKNKIVLFEISYLKFV